MFSKIKTNKQTKNDETVYGLYMGDMEMTWLLVDISEPLSHSTLKLVLLRDSLLYSTINVQLV